MEKIKVLVTVIGATLPAVMENISKLANDKAYRVEKIYEADFNSGELHVVYLTGYKNPEKKIEGIKAMRACTGMGLKEAKTAFENMIGIGINDKGSYMNISPIPYKWGVYSDGATAERYRIEFEREGFEVSIKKEHVNG